MIAALGSTHVRAERNRRAQTLPYHATVIPVMIASPSDILEERHAVREIIQEWNHINSMPTNAVLMPVGWDTHAAPELGGRPQALINEQVLKDCDLLVGIFWTRLGTPTGEAASGTVEEIQRHIDAGKSAMVYFSNAPVAPQSLDPDQFAALQEFKSWCQDKGLIETFDNILDFREKFRRQLGLKINQSEYLSGLLQGRRTQEPSHSALPAADKVPAEAASTPVGIITPGLSLNALSLGLSQEAQQLLLEASLDKAGTIINAAHIGGRTIQTNSKTFGEPGDRRSMARWEYALEQLVDQGFLVERGHKGEMFQITEPGYEVAKDLTTI